ncbi:hypothetical protein J7I93_16310 [Bacillus sp. ISL-47]|uniref:hypothetical protein n=1 Tax=Bacillus sp. ISL-47 TaxID=2819130 RepID=UPI001BE6EA2B|nr:hypothetical protein [Bacillus sp. ISL-47]MBT2689751.1 hypothetical protein [Bacillus sp. ISL-47]MBT2710164.1 hypothetical protein [Pseudomonas sp. ISL-84]
MKNRKRLLLSFVVICVLALFYISYMTFRSGHFTQWSHTEVSREMFEEHQAVYLGYDFSWEGIGTPILQSISLYKEDGTLLTEDDGQISIEAFIERTDKYNKTGAIPEDRAIQEGFTEDYYPVAGYPVKEDLRVIFRVELLDIKFEGDIGELIIKYKVFGLSQQQSVDFPNIIF